MLSIRGTAHHPGGDTARTGARRSRRNGVQALLLALVLGMTAWVGAFPGTSEQVDAATVTSANAAAGTGYWNYTVTTNPAVFPAAGGSITYTFDFYNHTGGATRNDPKDYLWLDQADIVGPCDAGTYKWSDNSTTWPRAIWDNGAHVFMTCTQYWGPNTSGTEKDVSQNITVTPSRGATYATSTNLAGLSVAMPLAQPSSTPTASNPLNGVSNGCTLGQFGVSNSALSSVCWLATAGWDPMVPGTTTGTQTVVVPNADGTPSDWTLTYTVSFSGNDLKLTTYNSPDWEGAALGNGNFGGANIPSFYNTGNGKDNTAPQMIYNGTEKVTLNSIKLTNTRTGQVPTTGWALVMADAESTNMQSDGVAETFNMTSNKAITNFLGTGGALPARPYGGKITNCSDTGWGSTSVTCTGTDFYGTKAIVGSADAPSTASITLKTSAYSEQGGTFGISLPNVEINKDVIDRVNSTDQFQVRVTDSASTVAATATTSGTSVYDSATGTHQAATEPKAVLAGSYTFAELSSGGTDLTKYYQSWNCSDRSGITSTAPTFTGATSSSTTVSHGTNTVSTGQIISCTVTNTPLPRIALTKNLVRNTSTDQTNIYVRNGATTLGTAVTTGSTVGSQATATTGVVTISPTSGTTFPSITLSEAMTANAADYVSSYTCTNATTGGTTVGSGTATSFAITPKLNDNITCTYTNVPKPRVTLVKELTRNVATDQATVAFSNGTTTLGTVTTSGSTVGTKTTASTATVAITPNADGSYPALTFTDTMTQNATKYTSSYSCTNTTAGGTTVATTSGTSFSLTPKAGDILTCTFTNTPKPAINITKTVNTVSAVAANGDYTVVYDVKATNTSVTAGTYGPIQDTPGFAANLVISKVEWTITGLGTWTTATGSAPYAIGTSKSLAGGATDSYQVRITFHATTATATAADTCSATPKSGEGLFNSVTATGETETTTDNSACASIVPPAPKLDLVKSVKSVTDTNGNGYNDAGDVINYTFTVTNTGPVTLAPVTVTDSLLGLTNMACVASLAPGASASCDATKTYTITASDVTVGKVTNTATATGTPPYTGTNNPPVDSPQRSTTTGVAPVGSAVVTKTDAKSGATQNGAVYSLYQATASTWNGTTPAPSASVCKAATAPGQTPIKTGLTTAGSGTVSITGLRLATYDYTNYQAITSGTYTVYCLVETKAPAGYELSAAPTVFTVNSASTPQAVSAKNVVHNLANILPLTGGRGVGASILGLALVAGAVALVVVRRRRMGE